MSACGGGGDSTPTNQAPTATSASIITNMGTAASVSPSVTDPDTGDSFSFTIVSAATHGTAGVNSTQLTYTPDAGYSGADSFTFRATDAGGLSVVGTASVTVNNQAPTAVSATLNTDQGSTSNPVSIAVIDPDTAHGDTHSFSLLTQPMHGIATLNGDQLTYQSDYAYNGADSFTIRAMDAGGLIVDGTASVTVNAVNQAPQATRAAFALYAMNASSRGLPLVDDNTLWDSFTVATTSTPTNGTASISNNLFQFLATDNTFSGADSFTYSVTDSNSQTINGTALVRIYNATNYARCTTPSTVNPDGTLGVRISVGPCAIYGEVVTRYDANNNPVTVKYIAVQPASGAEPKGAVMLIGGGDLNMNISGDPATGAITTTGGNFVVRTAQQLADGGYLAIAMDRPSDLPTGTVADVYVEMDAYRVSVDHTVDILNVLREINTSHLPVFLSGTSRGAMSVVANNLIANQIEISSAVTVDNTPDRLYVGVPGTPNLQLNYVQRPTYVLWHELDGCSLSSPANSLALYNGLTGLGVDTAMNIATGGTPVTAPSGNVTPSVCGAFDYHGFMGIEDTVATLRISQLDTTMANIFTNNGNHPPEAAYSRIVAASETGRSIELTAFTRDPDVTDTLSYALPSTTTVLGGSASINGSVVTYVPPVGISNKKDYLPYVVTDNFGGVAAAVLEIQIGN